MPENSESSSHPSDFERPYPIGWIDQLLTWIDRLPGPLWVYAICTLIFFFLLINAVFWIDGSLPVGVIDFEQGGYSFYIVYWFALYEILTRSGSQALHAFRPLLEATDRDFERIEYELSTLPRRTVWFATAVAVGYTTLMVLSEPSPYGEIATNSNLVLIFDILLTSLMTAPFFALSVRSIRQLLMVSRLHKRAKAISLFDLDPAHAFSTLTARTGGGVILALILIYLTTPEQMFSSLPDSIFTVSILLLAMVVFIAPLMGMQRLLYQEKKRQLAQTNELILAASKRLHHKVRVEDYTEMAGTKDAIAALMTEREMLEKISTWPWDPRTLRGFGSTMLLPIVIWVVTRLLERYL